MTINRGLAPEGVEMALFKIITRISGKGQTAQFLAMMSRIANKSTMIFIGEGAPTNEPCLGKIKNGASKGTLSNSGERPLLIKIMVGKSSSGSRCLMSSMSFLTSEGRRRNKG